MKFDPEAMRRVILTGVLIAAGVGCARDIGTDREDAGAVRETQALSGLGERVEVVIDRWGVPHIFASSQDDLFMAQGFVQAQGRLFQMDLWRRSTQGRLAEILGSEYVERDRMARLLRYRGDMHEEWASYAPDAESIVGQFVAGVNEAVAIAKRNPPVEFRLAGYEPEVWDPEDVVLSRLEAFSLTGNAASEVLRARIVAATGVEQMVSLLPPDPLVPVRVPHGTDVGLVGPELAAALRVLSAPLLFGPVSPGSIKEAIDLLPLETGSNSWAVHGSRSMSGKPLLADDGHRALDHPSIRYIVHLNAPGWNVIGGVVPWFPGVAKGHNHRVAWGSTNFRIDGQDLCIERVNPDNHRQYEYRGQWVNMEVAREQIPVKGQAPVEVELEYTRHGPIILRDPAKHVAFSLRWTGAEPGAAAFLGALGLNRAQNWSEFRDGLRRWWKTPGQNLIYADIDGNIAYQAAGLAPIRSGWSGLLPVPGWSGDYEWEGWYKLEDLPHDLNPDAGFLANANNNTLPADEQRVIGYEWSDPARINRLEQVLSSGDEFSVSEFGELVHDKLSWNAERLVPLLAGLRPEKRETEFGIELLLNWDRRVSVDSPAATLYVIWERTLLDLLLAGKLPSALQAEYRARASGLLVPLITEPNSQWFGNDVEGSRNHLLLAALEAGIAELKSIAGDDVHSWSWGHFHQAEFRHPLAIDEERAGLLNIGPFPRGGYGLTVFAAGSRGATLEQRSGGTYRMIADLNDWDRSVAINAPGQSGDPNSTHFADLATVWAEEQFFPLLFSRSAIEAHAARRVTLVPQE